MDGEAALHAGVSGVILMFVPLASCRFLVTPVGRRHLVPRERDASSKFLSSTSLASPPGLRCHLTLVKRMADLSKLPFSCVCSPALNLCIQDLPGEFRCARVHVWAAAKHFYGLSQSR